MTDPDTSGTIPVIGAEGTLGTGTLVDLQSLPLVGNELTVKGFSRLCIVDPSCNSFTLDIPYFLDASNRVGVGGLLTAGGNGAIRISLEAAPWTIGSGTAINQTQEGNFKTVTVTGFAHGAGSGALSAAASGMIQLISPMQITTVNAGDNNESQSVFSILTLHFVPEPGMLLMLASALCFLCLTRR